MPELTFEEKPVTGTVVESSIVHVRNQNANVMKPW